MDGWDPQSWSSAGTQEQLELQPNPALQAGYAHEAPVQSTKCLQKAWHHQNDRPGQEEKEEEQEGAELPERPTPLVCPSMRSEPGPASAPRKPY